jgi:hypothetical protein
VGADGDDDDEPPEERPVRLKRAHEEDQVGRKSRRVLNLGDNSPNGRFLTLGGFLIQR